MPTFGPIRSSHLAERQPLARDRDLGRAADSHQRADRLDALRQRDRHARPDRSTPRRASPRRARCACRHSARTSPARSRRQRHGFGRCDGRGRHAARCSAPSVSFAGGSSGALGRRARAPVRASAAKRQARRAVKASAWRRRRLFIEVLPRRAAGLECKVPPPRRNIRPLSEGGQTAMSIVLSENFRALFYAPFYAALATGAFRDAGVEVTLRPSPSPAAAARALRAGEVDVMWGGPLRVMMRARQRAAGRPRLLLPMSWRAIPSS